MTRASHPGGYPVADDAPAFVAPPLDLRRAVDAVERGDVEDAVVYTLAFPIVERVRIEDHESTAPDSLGGPDTLGAGDMDGERTAPGLPSPDSTMLVAAESSEATLVDLPAVSVALLGREVAVDSESTIERDPYRDNGEVTLLATERESLERALGSLGPFDAASDLHVERPFADRVLLARARAIRFRLAMLDAWPEDGSMSSPAEEALELVVHVAATVAFARGTPVDARGASPIDLALARAIVSHVRTRVPATSRATVRDAGSAAAARVTLLGTRKAIDYVRERFGELPGADRRSSLALASRLASSGDARDPRSIAAALLREAIG